MSRSNNLGALIVVSMLFAWLGSLTIMHSILTSLETNVDVVDAGPGPLFLKPPTPNPNNVKVKAYSINKNLAKPKKKMGIGKC
jgi:hypothetical protein